MANNACQIRAGDTLLLPPVGGLGTFHHLPMTVGSKSTNIALGTCFPEPVSLKKVPKEESTCSEDASEESMDPMLQAIQFPAGIAHLDASLANVDRNPLHQDGREEEVMSIH